jgi:hypothetical protein
MQMGRGSTSGCCLGGVLLGVPQFGDRDGQGHQVRDERGGEHGAVPGDAVGQGYQPGGGAQLVPLPGGPGNPAVPGAGDPVVAIGRAAQEPAIKSARGGVQGVRRRPCSIGCLSRIL